MATIDFSTRSQQPELMDDTSVGFEELRNCLADLARVNALTQAHRPTLAFLDALVSRMGRLARPLQILDVGSGYGDTLRHIDTWACQRGVAVSLAGVDLNPWSCKAATDATPSGRGIRWVTADAFAFEPTGGIDVVVSSLFTHHLPEAAIVRFIRRMENSARLGWFVNDLHRHPVPYYLFRTFAKLADYHPFVQHDGPVSITRAFVPADWRRMVEAAHVDVSSVNIRRSLPFRLTVSRFKGP
ncbi:MAG: 3-demethylubiquinone-9 3-O-methyltransferase [Pseudomonadota bacterium]|jgi:SAM-dependent methyltransferase